MICSYGDIIEKIFYWVTSLISTVNCLLVNLKCQKVILIFKNAKSWELAIVLRGISPSDYYY